MVDLHPPGSQSPGAAAFYSIRRDGLTGFLRWPNLSLLAVPAVWVTTRIMFANLAGIPHLERYLATLALLWGLGVGLGLAFVRLGLEAKPAVYTSFVLMTSFVSFGPLSRQLGTGVGLVGLALLTGAAGWLSVRLNGTVLLDALVVAGAAFLLSGPIFIAIDGFAEYGENTLEASDPISVTMTERPDIWLVILDGYPGSITMESDFGVPVASQLGPSLLDEGFDVPASAWSAYTTTKLSVPSMLDMGYPTTSWTDNEATLQALYNKISGESSLLDLLTANGYETTMIEAGWSGSSCGPRFDHCVAPPLYDDAANLMTFDSVLGGNDFATPGYGFATGSRASMTRLLEMADRERSDGAPSFVFAHLLAPHPPMFLDASCQLTVDETRKGLFYTYPGVSAEDRDSAFLGQVACVDSFVLDFARRVDPEDVVVFVADHGTGRRAQMATPPEQWSRDAIRERMNVFLAVRTRGECSLGDVVILPNLLRRVLGCYSESEIEDLDPRVFLGPTTELATPLVTSMLDSPTD